MPLFIHEEYYSDFIHSGHIIRIIKADNKEEAKQFVQKELEYENFNNTGTLTEIDDTKKGILYKSFFSEGFSSL